MKNTFRFLEIYLRFVLFLLVVFLYLILEQEGVYGEGAIWFSILAMVIVFFSSGFSVIYRATPIAIFSSLAIAFSIILTMDHSLVLNLSCIVGIMLMATIATIVANDSEDFLEQFFLKRFVYELLVPTATGVWFYFEQQGNRAEGTIIAIILIGIQIVLAHKERNDFTTLHTSG